ncbi:MAG: hypothetical protein IKP76_03335 [Bacilli bacterium]|nr:hypothetical protein [Bacilli bacterium]
MEKDIKSISSLITAFETRNELLHEEIKRNEEAIQEMEKKLIIMEEDNKELTSKDDKSEVTA